jgi:hypothetical protein
MIVARNDVMEALKAKIVATGYFKTVSRRVKLWTETPAVEQPACFIAEHSETRAHQSANLPKDSMAADLFVYTVAPNKDDVPASIQNAALDAIDTALAPTGADKMRARQTLGGLVSHCYAEGRVLKDPGDLDGQGVAVVPVTILIP